MAGVHLWEKNGEGRAVRRHFTTQGAAKRGETEGVCPEKDDRKTDVGGEKSVGWLMK